MKKSTSSFWPLGTLASWIADDRRLVVIALCGASAEDSVDFHASLARNSLPIELSFVHAR